MNPFQAAIMRILTQHYGGNVNDPRASNWLRRLSMGAEGQNRTNQAFIGQLGAGFNPTGYQFYNGHYIPGGTHVGG